MKIKQDQIMILRELLVTQMNHWTFFPFYLVLSIDIAGVDTPNILLWLLLGCIPFFFYLIRTRLKFLWMILLHIAVPIILFLLPAENIGIQFIQVAVGFIYAVYSIFLWAKINEKKDGKVLPLLMVGISVVMMYLLHFQNHREWDSAVITSLIVVIGLYFINYYVEQYQNFLTVNQSSAGHIPAKEMFRSGMGLVFGYTGIGIALLILISNGDWLLAILKVIKNILSLLIRGIQALFPREDGLMEEPIINETPDMAGDMMAGLEPEESFWLWQVLEYVIIVLVFVLFVVTLIKGFIALVGFIKSKLVIQNVEKAYTPGEDVVDVREKCDIIRSNEWKMSIPFLNLNPKDRIRNLYKKHLLFSRSSFDCGKEPEKLNLYTARESSRILDKEELAYIYEKARYTNEECSTEDVKRMKTACK